VLEDRVIQAMEPGSLSDRAEEILTSRCSLGCTAI